MKPVIQFHPPTYYTLENTVIQKDVVEQKWYLFLPEYPQIGKKIFRTKKEAVKYLLNHKYETILYKL